LKIQRVAVEYDTRAWEATATRFGLIALATDHASERELRFMMPSDTELFTTRVRFDGQCSVANLRSMATGLADATGLLLPGTPLHAIAFGCTSGTVAIGFERVCEMVRSARPGIAVATPITGAGRAFTALSAQRLAVLTPYPDDVNELVAGYLHRQGVEVLSFASLGLATDLEMTSVPPEAIERAVGALDTARADAVFVCCTALRSVAIIDTLEALLGLPVVTSNQAMLWEMLSGAGYLEPVLGFGRLLAAAPRGVPAWSAF
jgi:maleate isomerase